jgi:uncharacterized membrane protein
MGIEPERDLRPVEGRESVSVRREEIVDAPPVPAEEVHEDSVQAGPGGIVREHRVQNFAGDEHREVVVDDVATARLVWADKLTQAVWLIIGIIVALIAIRVLLRLLAANPAAGFTSFIYNASAPFLAPFFGVVGSPAAGGSVLEVPSLIAVVVYLLIGWLFATLIWMLLDRPVTRSASRYDRFHI